MAFEKSVILQVACQWTEDPRWRTAEGAGSRLQPSHKAKVPSRWLPVASGGHSWDSSLPHPGRVRLIDFLHVPKSRGYAT